MDESSRVGFMKKRGGEKKERSRSEEDETAKPRFPLRVTPRSVCVCLCVYVCLCVCRGGGNGQTSSEPLTLSSLCVTAAGSKSQQAACQRSETPPAGAVPISAWGACHLSRFRTGNVAVCRPGALVLLNWAFRWKEVSAEQTRQ